MTKTPPVSPNSIVCLAAGIFLLGPGLVKPQELFVPLLAGTAALIIDVGLWCSRKNKKNPFDKSANLLLTGEDVIPEGQAIQDNLHIHFQLNFGWFYKSLIASKYVNMDL